MHQLRQALLPKILSFIIMFALLGMCCACSFSTEVPENSTISTEPSTTPGAAQTIPILLYHHLDETAAESGTVLSPERFEQQMQLLSENGYTTVTFDNIIAFVESGTSLPDNPVIITFDDGYMSNYEYAFPILQKYGFKATIFAIGCSIGHDKYYKNTQYEMTPHFGAKEIAEMTASGVIDIQSHTYDMHQWAPFESTEPARTTILPFENESDVTYKAALMKDVEQQHDAFESCGLAKSYVLAFPQGAYTAFTNEILVSCGYKVTVTTEADRVNTIVYGEPESLIGLGRMNIDPNVTDEAILEYCGMGE